MRKLFLLTGEGIECEKESRRFFNHYELDIHEVPVPKLLALSVSNKGETAFSKSFFDSVNQNDVVFFPGGFSFSDHLGSGKLLSFHLSKLNFFERLIEKGAVLMGVCNGFQVLVAAGLFGNNVSLESNAHKQGFVDRWLSCKSPLVEGALRLCVRHGEGQLKIEGSLAFNVKVVLRYDEPSFDNGSRERIAGLVAEFQSGARVYGFMPHPELSARKIDDPDVVPCDYGSNQKRELLKPDYSGFEFMNALLKICPKNPSLREELKKS